MSGTLVVVPCGRRKIWKQEPDRGPTPTAEAYTGTPFMLNRQYAVRFGDRWVVPSAKKGFIAPNFEILGPYDVSFKQPSTDAASTDESASPSTTSLMSASTLAVWNAL